jgi:hypothetical protein
MSVESTTTAPLTLRFEGGTLIVDGLPEGDPGGLPGLKRDVRTGAFRAEAIWYRALVQHLYDRKIPYDDQAKRYEKTRWTIRIDKPAYTETEDYMGRCVF